MKKGIFVVISGPSGVGKNTIADALVEKGYGIYSVSMTTRKKRHGEIEAKDYFFVTEEEFKRNINDNNFLEYAKYNNNFYGTLKSFIFDNINNGTNVIAILEVQGALNIEKIFPEAVLIFIMPPDMKELERRLRNRGTETLDVTLERLKLANEEIKYSDKYDYTVINSTVDKAVKEIIDIICIEEKNINKN